MRRLWYKEVILGQGQHCMDQIMAIGIKEYRYCFRYFELRTMVRVIISLRHLAKHIIKKPITLLENRVFEFHGYKTSEILSVFKYINF